MAVLEVNMPYIGRLLSVNYYKIRGRNGVQTNKTEPAVELWMTELASKVRGFQFGKTLTVELEGHFKDGRVPDLHNLHKVIGDALSTGLQRNDKNFEFVDLSYGIGNVEPYLTIRLKE